MVQILFEGNRQIVALKLSISIQALFKLFEEGLSVCNWINSVYKQINNRLPSKEYLENLVQARTIFCFR